MQKLRQVIGDPAAARKHGVSDRHVDNADMRQHAMELVRLTCHEDPVILLQHESSVRHDGFSFSDNRTYKHLGTGDGRQIGKLHIHQA